jgi:hypothetical protein
VTSGTLVPDPIPLTVFHADDLARANSGLYLSNQYLDAWARPAPSIGRFVHNMNVHGDWRYQPWHIPPENKMSWTWNRQHQGMPPPEWMARLVNEMELKRFWLNIHAYMYDDTWIEYANRLKAELDVDVEIWLQCGNEVWNGASLPNAVNVFFANNSRWFDLFGAPAYYATYAGGTDGIFTCIGADERTTTPVAHGFVSGTQPDANRITLFSTNFNLDGHFTSGNYAVATRIDDFTFRLTGIETGDGDNFGEVPGQDGRQLRRSSWPYGRIHYKKWVDEPRQNIGNPYGTIGSGQTPESDKSRRHIYHAERALECWAIFENIFGASRIKRIADGHRNNVFGSLTEPAQFVPTYISTADYWAIGTYWNLSNSGRTEAATNSTTSWYQSNDAQKELTWLYVAGEQSSGLREGDDIRAHIDELKRITGTNAQGFPNLPIVGYESDSGLGHGGGGSGSNLTYNRNWQDNGSYPDFHSWYYQHLADLGFAAACMFRSMGNSNAFAAASSYGNLGNKYNSVRADVTAGGRNRT